MFAVGILVSLDVVSYDEHLLTTGVTVTFGLIFFFAVVEASLATWLSVRFHQHHNAFKTDVKTRTHFLCFTAWWTVLFSVVYMGLFLHSASTGSVATSVASHLGWCVIIPAMKFLHADIWMLGWH